MNVFPQTAQLLLHAILGGYLPYALAAPVLLGLGVLANRKVASYQTWLEWSPFHVKANAVLLPVRWRYVWAPYAALLALAMPFLALIEEWVFRAGEGPAGLHGILWATLGFGLLHLTSLISLRMALYLSLIGGVLYVAYGLGGIMAAFVLHATYNLCALTMVVATRTKELKL